MVLDYYMALSQKMNGFYRALIRFKSTLSDLEVESLKISYYTDFIFGLAIPLGWGGGDSSLRQNDLTRLLYTGRSDLIP
jgi:hypothetical protein